jgi:TQXA domain-containing protein
MASRINLARVGAAVLGVSVALMVGALPASAGTSSSPTDPVTGSVDLSPAGPDASQDGTPITVDLTPAEGGRKVHTNGVLAFLDLSKNGASAGTVPTYCIDLTTSLDVHTTMTEGDWATFAGRTGSQFSANSKYINWILQNSYPSVDVSALATAAGIPGKLSQTDAISGTQAAIWHFSDGATLETGKNANLDALYAYLTGGTNAGIAEPSLDITPIHTGGLAGKLIGPFTIGTNLTGSLAVDASLLPKGVTVTDANGNQIGSSNLTAGSKFYLDVAATATATSGSLVISGTALSGRIFVSPAKSQQLIAAGKTAVSTLSSATWTMSSPSTTSATPTPVANGTTPKATGPTGQLAYTGFSTTGPIVLGILLLAAGGLFLLVQRRLKRTA